MGRKKLRSIRCYLSAAHHPNTWRAASISRSYTTVYSRNARNACCNWGTAAGSDIG